MLTYKYYRFPDSSLCPPIDEWPSGVSVDVIGQIIDEEGNESTPPTYKEGWHVNVCSQSDINLDFIKEYEITVNTPRRKWFGQ